MLATGWLLKRVSRHVIASWATRGMGWLALVSVIATSGCGVFRKDPLIGQWREVSGRGTMEFFSDGTAVANDPRQGLSTALQWHRLSDQRVKVEGMVLGVAVLDVYEVSVEDDVLKMRGLSGEVEAWRRVETTGAPNTETLKTDAEMSAETMRTMRTIATLAGEFMADTNHYPNTSSIQDFKRVVERYGEASVTDAWGNRFEFSSTEDHYELRSLGADGVRDMRIWGGESTDYAVDIVHENGTFSQWHTNDD